MSQETMEWLNQFVLVGYTDLRGNAWHYAEALQGEPNHYPGAIPVADVVRRLFNFEVVSVPLYVPDGNGGFTQVPERQAMQAGKGAPFENEIFGIFKDGYRGHSYEQWLLENAENIVGESLAIGSAALLRKGAQAFVSYEMNETAQIGGVNFRPQLLSFTSYDGSLATGYKWSSVISVCDNTFQSAREEKDTASFKLKHTRYSEGRVLEAREALGIMFETQDAIGQEIERLLETEVTRKQFNQIVENLVPLPVDKDGKVEEKSRGLTLAINKQDSLKSLYDNDMRVAPWAGTGWGVVSAFNTYNHHIATVKNTVRSLRNIGNAIGNTVRDSDDAVIAEMEKVLQAA